MPHKLIRKLNELQNIAFEPVIQADITLGGRGCPMLPEHALDLLDEIQDCARAVFGFTELNMAQDHLMKQSGFPVNWRAGVIGTVKGLVRYKEPTR